MYKRNNFFSGPTMINPCSYVSPFTMENQGYVVLYEKLFAKLFEKWFRFFDIFEKLFI